MRYFKTSNASRQYPAGGSIFVFEPVDQIGGSWLGVLALEESSASALAATAIPQIEEITEEQYTELKKKPLAPSATLHGPRVEPPSPPPRPAAQVVRSPAPQVSDAVTEVAEEAAVPAVAAGVVLKTALVEVPDELVATAGDKSASQRGKK